MRLWWLMARWESRAHMHMQSHARTHTHTHSHTCTHSHAHAHTHARAQAPEVDARADEVVVADGEAAGMRADEVGVADGEAGVARTHAHQAPVMAGQEVGVDSEPEEYDAETSTAVAEANTTAAARADTLAVGACSWPPSARAVTAARRCAQMATAHAAKKDVVEPGLTELLQWQEKLKGWVQCVLCFQVQQILSLL
jgi:hypothetical protein